MLITLINLVYILYCALSLNEVGVLLRIFGAMSKVVVVFGCVSVIIIVLIAYPIHATFMNFSQPIEGQIYKDLNLFDSLYQGVLTLFEFVFGAVVLVRPYLEQNETTYILTFVMTMFSFFGNIMLANMLVAFLTSSFENINHNAKLLTMTTQYMFIEIYTMKELDSVFSTPYFLALPAVPAFLMMISKTSKRARANEFLRKVNHFYSVFLPAFVLSNLKLILLMFHRYITIGLYLFF